MLKTKVDDLYELLQKNLEMTVGDMAKKLNIPSGNVMKIARYLEEDGVISINRTVMGLMLKFEKSPSSTIEQLDSEELINKIQLYQNSNNIKLAYDLVFKLYNACLVKKDDKELQEKYRKVHTAYLKSFKKVKGMEKHPAKVLDSYKINISHKLKIIVNIIKKELELTPVYSLMLTDISDVTKLVLEKMREEVVHKLSFSTLMSKHKEKALQKEYQKMILKLMNEVFSDLTDEQLQIFVEYTSLITLGMGEMEFLLKDGLLEEIVVNNSKTPIWVYHIKHGWLKTNIIVEDDKKIRHYATLAARQINKNITLLEPLLDGYLSTGDRINATLMPITPGGNTITIRKFSEIPWTITTFLKNNTLSPEIAAWIWMAVQYELSTLIVGGTGSGKTSALNVFSIFFQPNQRVISIEDTKELKLAKTLHWVSMLTRMPNPEGKGEVKMLDLVVNSLRMRPDRIVVGEIRRKAEAEVLFEAMHTGHSVYSTLHANSVGETITRLTTPPIDIPQSLLSSLSLIIVQHRNRRTGIRRTLQIAEIKPDGNAEVIYEYNMAKDRMEKLSEFRTLFSNLRLLTGLSREEIKKDLNEKIAILKYFVKNDVYQIEDLSSIISDYYSNKDYLLKKLKIKR